MNVLIACEESQTVCMAFRSYGFDAFSCDIQPCSGGYPQYHICGDVIPLLNGHCSFYTMDGVLHSILGKWDIIIAHPPCTFLSVVGNAWFNIEKYGDKALQRYKDRALAVDFFMKFVSADCDRVCIENPVGIMSKRFRRPDQIIQPWYFGDPFEKRTCLWLKGLFPLNPTFIVDPPPRTIFKSGRSMAEWYNVAARLPPSERSRVRSKTFPGIANAMASQWGLFI